MKKEFLQRFGESEDSDIRQILNRSHPATCGAFEKEVNVKKENVTKIKRLLKSKGFFIVGTSENGGKSRKIWFNPAGMNL